MTTATVIGPKPLTDEIYREYDFGNRTYRVSDPVSLFLREGGTTHRVLDKSGVVHCIPFPTCGGQPVILRWAPRDQQNPVAF